MSDVKVDIEQDEIWEDFNAWLRDGTVEVVFTKKDGTERTMNCTLVPEAYAGYEFAGSGSGLNDKIVTVWDTDKQAWRVVSNGSIISIAYYD